MLQYRIYSPLPSNRTVEKSIFLCILVLLKRQKIMYRPSMSIHAVNREIPLTWSTQIASSKVQHNFTFCCTFCFSFCCTFCCNKCLYILLETLLYFSMKFCLKVKYRMFYIKIHQFFCKELLSHFRVYIKSTTSAQTDGRIATDGPLYTGV